MARSRARKTGTYVLKGDGEASCSSTSAAPEKRLAINRRWFFWTSISSQRRPRLAHQHVSGVEMNCKYNLQAMMFSTFKGPFEEDIDESGAQFMRSLLFDRRAISPLYKGGMRASCACQKHSKSGNTGDLLLCVYSQMPCVVSFAG